MNNGKSEIFRTLSEKTKLLGEALRVTLHISEEIKKRDDDISEDIVTQLVEERAAIVAKLRNADLALTHASAALTESDAAFWTEAKNIASS